MLLPVKHIFSFFLLALVPRVLADPKPSAEALRFSALAASSPDGVIKLDSKTFDAITTGYREWSVVVQLTALGSDFKCAPCKQFDPNFRAVSKAWKKVPAKDRDTHFFATLDFQDGRDIFQRLGLNSAPFVNFYPAKLGPRAPASGKTDPWSYDFNSNAFDALTLAEQLSPSTPVPIPYKEPPNYALIASAGATFLFILITARFFWMFFSSVFLSRWTWGFVTIATSIVMCSGFMFVRIRNMPLAVTTKTGASWVANGFQTQYGGETYAMSLLYGALAFSFVSLTLLVPKIPTAGRQRAGVYLWTTALMVLYSLLITLFRLKNPGYPFGLIF
ncbi:hypothetical protein BOTBODRAFT_166427 [Botryobasidium botryosum FD-172 SS1]|uniref:Dolichyl-diphosphooligosaccharide-protein glycotransferase n=1 Tax=Botryobasidium botryosum (strain FD-172 SS1) TaxID=930990 RepID=A0A067LXK4_BOTB1|nr:hypothetical protein BOTBODRAFT_166427 [Botryobasidium botryosum FD-172 SS1]